MIFVQADPDDEDSEYVPPEWKRCRASVAARETWARVLRHTRVVENSRLEPMPELERPSWSAPPSWLAVLPRPRLPLTPYDSFQFPPELYEGVTALPALKVVHGFHCGINSLAAHTYIDVWPVTDLTNRRLCYPVRHLPNEAEMHVMIVLCNFKTDNVTLPYTTGDSWHSKMFFVNPAKQHLVMVLRALYPNADEGCERVHPSLTFLHYFFQIIAQCAHERYTLVGLDEMPPRLLGLSPSAQKEEARCFLQSDTFLEIICRSRNPYSPWFNYQPTVMNLKRRVRCVTTQEWRAEIGEEAWAYQTLAAREDIGF
jgi:hypothetical protein